MIVSISKSTPGDEKSVLPYLSTRADRGRLERGKSPNWENERGGGLKKLMGN